MTISGIELARWRTQGRMIPTEAGEVTYMPNNTVAVPDPEIAQRILKLIDALDDNDDVQSVSHNADLPESVTV